MLLPRERKGVSFIFLFAVASVFGIGVFASLYVYSEVDMSGRAHILDRAKTVAALIPSENSALLLGSEDDIGTGVYENLKGELMEARAANSDIRFLYLMGVRDGEVFFYADSERETSEDYSPPGQVYDEATDDMRAVFLDGIPRVEGPERDRWGTWISAYAPVLNDSGQVVAILGIDLPADEFLRTLYVYAVIPLLLALSTILIIFASELIRRRSEKAVEEKEEFLSIASHEIRTPLAGVRWGLEQLSRDPERVLQKNPELLPLMHDTSVTLIARLNTLLDVRSLGHKKEREFKKDLIYIETFLREAASTLTLSAEERGVAIELPRVGNASMSGDSQLLRHVFQNIIGNAIKYTKQNTNVRVEYAKEHGMHIFRFKDEGEGIPEDEQDSIFTGYHRGENARTGGVSGTGLGLYMARKAVLMHGGTIAVDSVLTKGTTITVQIPE